MRKAWIVGFALLAFGVVLARGLDDAFLRIAELDLPGFAAVYLDDDQQGFVVALVPERVKQPVNLTRYYQEPFGAELPLSQAEKRELWRVILPRLQEVTEHPLLTPDARVRFVVARYSYEQLKEWVELIGKYSLLMPSTDPRKVKPIPPCDFIYGYGFRDMNNTIVLAVRCSTLDRDALRPVQEDLLDKLERLGIPRKAVSFSFSLDLPTDLPGDDGGNP